MASSRHGGTVWGFGLIEGGVEPPQPGLSGLWAQSWYQCGAIMEQSSGWWRWWCSPCRSVSSTETGFLFLGTSEHWSCRLSGSKSGDKRNSSDLSHIKKQSIAKSISSLVILVEFSQNCHEFVILRWTPSSLYSLESVMTKLWKSLVTSDKSSSQVLTPPKIPDRWRCPAYQVVSKSISS